MDLSKFDALIIGGGPAGISCASELKDSGLTSIILERSGQLGGQLSEIPNPLRNFAGGNYDNGEALRLKLVELVERMSFDCLLNHGVSEVDLAHKTLKSAGRELRGKTIVLATGYRVARLGLPGENKFGLDVVYRTGHCIEHIKGNPVAIVGGGDSAIMDALELAEFCPEVYVIHRSAKLKARPDVIETAKHNKRIKFLPDTKVVSLTSDGASQVSSNLAGVQVVSCQTNRQYELPVKRLVVKIGYAPNTEPFVGQVDMDSSGHVRIGEYCSTSVAGVFAVGDITNPNYPRIATSVGHGVLAACGIRKYLDVVN